MVDIRVKDHTLYVKSEYNQNIVNFMRSRPVRKWNINTRQWEIPEQELENLIPILNGLEYKIKYEEVPNPINEIPESYTFKTKPFEHQKEAIAYGLKHNKFLLADEQGCVDGDMEISYNLSGASHRVKLSEFYKTYQKSKVKDKFKVRCLKDNIFGLNSVRNVVFSGIKDVYKLSTNDGKSVNVTSDHEILTDSGFKSLNNISVGDTIITNGDVLTCPICGTTENIVTYPYAKFYGYCRSCMYSQRDGKKYKGDEIGRVVGKDGYIFLYGKKYRKHPRYTPNGIPEHVVVAEEKIGRMLREDEVVHHINRCVSDNSPDNLMVLTKQEHYLIHDPETHFHRDYVHSSGSTVIVIPKKSKVSSIEYVGKKETYDIVMEDPYRNFVANKIVVHNCGKSKTVLDLACIFKQERKYKHVLIITCVNSIKYNWRNEVQTHTNENGYILGTKLTKKGTEYIGSNEDRLADIQRIETNPNYFIITNIETLRYNKKIEIPCKTKKNDVQRYKKKTVFPIVEELQKQLKNGNISMIIVDEIHRCLAPETKIKTNSGYVEIQEIFNNRNYMIATLCPDGNIEYVEPSNYFVNPVFDNMIKLSFLTDGGEEKEIVCTKDHRFLTKNRGYVSAEDITEQDEVVCFD